MVYINHQRPEEPGSQKKEIGDWTNGKNVQKLQILLNLRTVDWKVPESTLPDGIR